MGIVQGETKLGSGYFSMNFHSTIRICIRVTKVFHTSIGILLEIGGIYIE